MQNSWVNIKNFFDSNGVFLCKSSKQKDATFRIDVKHIMDPPASKHELNMLTKLLHKDLTPSHRKFFALCNGGAFFTRERSNFYEGGFMLYSTDYLNAAHAETIGWLIDIMDDVFEDMDSEQEKIEKEKCLEWIKSLLIIGEEMQSGNYLAIDYSCEEVHNEYPVIFIDHEVVFHGSIKYQKKTIGASIDNVLLCAIDNPVHFLSNVLGGCTCYFDRQTGGQLNLLKYKTL